MTAVPLPDGLHEVAAGKVAAVVTSLEMRRPPVLPRADRPGFRLRHEASPDPHWYRALFREIGAPWLWSSRLLLDDAALSRLIGDPAVDVLAVERAGTDIGLAELDFRLAGACEIAFFGLVAEATGSGVGAWLMAQVLARAWARPIARLWVHTCTLDHPAALAFYLRSGFVAFRRQVEIMDDPRGLGLLPQDTAPGVPPL